MYVQITTKCNMSCSHCCFGCRPGIGQDMTKEMFIEACQLAVDTTGHIMLGGGEPTVHPLFWEFVGIAQKYAALGDMNLCKIWLATNGSRTEDALALANLTRAGVLEAVLSRDLFHDPIDHEVVAAVYELQKPIYNERYGAGRRFEGVRDNSGDITPHGSAKKNQLQHSEGKCCCDTPLIMPNGNYFGCGCRRFKLGTISNYTIPEDYELGECMVQYRKKIKGDPVDVCYS